MSVSEFYAQARPKRRPRQGPPELPEKPALPPLEARRITEDYRKHLEGK